MSDDGWGWSVPGSLPGYEAELRRLDRLERLEQQRLQAERLEAAEQRREAAMVRRMREWSFQGRPFDPGNWASLAEDPDRIAAEVFAVQDAQALREQRRAMIDAGLWTDLGPLPPGAVLASGDEVVMPPGTRRASASPAASRASVREKVRQALRRWQRPAAEVRRVDAVPDDRREDGYIVRGVWQYR